MTVSQYFSGLFGGIKALLTGMTVTLKELFTKKITQQYPENRKTLVIPERVRGVLTMPHDENNEHACTACGICQMNCPNGTITVESEMVQTEDGKKKRVLTTYTYRLGQCTFCNLCVLTCPSNAIVFSNEFESAVYNKARLTEKLNHEGSKLREKKVAPKPAPAPKPVAEKGAEENTAVKPKTETPIEEKTEKTPVETEKKTEIPTPVEKKAEEGTKKDKE